MTRRSRSPPRPPPLRRRPSAGEGAAFVPPSFKALARPIDAVRSDAGHLFATIQNDNPFAAAARTANCTPCASLPTA